MPRTARRPVRPPSATPAPTRDRLLDAAAREFAERGFDGAKVDRIAARARVNKAMLYYHFDNKAALYRAILHDVFATVANAVSAVRDTAGTPDERLRAYIQIVARQLIARPHFPPLWLREVAEGGRHLDAGTVSQMRRVVETLATLLQEGRRAGVFANVNPFIAQVGIIAPLLMIAASAPVRERFRRQIPGPVAAASYADAIAHVEAATLAAVLAPGSHSPARAPAHSGSTSS